MSTAAQAMRIYLLINALASLPEAGKHITSRSTTSCHSRLNHDFGTISAHSTQCSVYSWYISLANGGIVQLRFPSRRHPYGHFLLFVYDGSKVLDYKLIKSFSGLSHQERSLRKVEASGADMLVVLKVTSLSYRLSLNITYQKKGVCFGGQKNCMYGDNDCYSAYETCDGIWDCRLSGRDEMHCGCPNQLVKCADMNTCYAQTQHCDGVIQCNDKSDESYCSEQVCRADRSLFLCTNRRCIQLKDYCDGEDDCGDMSDEVHCTGVDKTKLVFVSTSMSLLSAFGLVIFGCVLCRLHRARMLTFHQSLQSPLFRLEQGLRPQCPASPPSYNEAVSSVDPQVAPVVDDDADVPLLDLAGADGNDVAVPMTSEEEESSPIPAGKADVQVEVVRHSDEWSLVDSVQSCVSSVSSLEEEDDLNNASLSESRPLL